MKFVTTILQSGNNTGIIVPPEVRDALNGGKNPLVVVSLADEPRPRSMLTHTKSLQ